MPAPHPLRYVNRTLGGLVLIVSIGLLAAVMLVVHRGEWFAPVVHLTARVAESDFDGLAAGADIYLLGERVGEIEDVTYADDGESLRVTLAIRETAMRRLRGNSVAYIRRRLAGLGEAYLDIKRSAAPDRPRANDQEMTIVSSSGVAEVLALIPNQGRDIHRTVMTMIDHMLPASKAAGGAIDGIQANGDAIAALVNDVRPLGKRLRPVATRAGQLGDEFKVLSGNLRAELDELLDTPPRDTEDLRTAARLLDRLECDPSCPLHMRGRSRVPGR